MKMRKVVKTAKKNYLFVIFALGIFIVGFYIVSKSVFSKPSYVYVKVKVGQGLWWAATTRPNNWYAQSIKVGDTKLGMGGKPDAHVLSVRRYPSPTITWLSNQYDVYVTLLLKSGLNKKTGGYSYNRGQLSIGSPIEVQFPKVDLTGTVIEISEKPFLDEFVYKTIYLVYQGGFNEDFPYRYNNIQIGGTYNDGTGIVFEVIDKALEKNIWPIANNLTGYVYEREITTTQNIVVKDKVKLLKKTSGLFYGEDYKVTVNASIPFYTDNYYFENFQIRKIE